MKKIVFFVPNTHVEQVKEAVFNAGAGRIGNYDKCCFELQGVGQYRPTEGSNAFIGTTGKVERVAETRVEMVCEAESVRSAIDALKKSHPYETPAYEVYILDEY